MVPWGWWLQPRVVGRLGGNGGADACQLRGTRDTRQLDDAVAAIQSRASKRPELRNNLQSYKAASSNLRYIPQLRPVGSPGKLKVGVPKRALGIGSCVIQRVSGGLRACGLKAASEMPTLTRTLTYTQDVSQVCLKCR